MQWIAANSTTLGKFRYDPNALILEIEFNKGSVYQYFDVPHTIYESLVIQVNSGGSAGQYFSSNIKGYYRFSRI